ncbi:VOC family protein [Falsiroseomonas tokyonensis]|uniref:VOC family protein n=1 Tax=Falsiroseomonas tokyonensis TaxID=430521 RepID=A0ABV7BN11_9PROT|nr:VOC family protein [Falsiroseomonas tokyonensis]MBU8536979.1 VOC family protein [Falsiroseomonas tokyonensis]
MGDRGAPPRSGWAGFVPELMVNDLPASLAFWREVLGFGLAYDRPEELFVYLEHPDAGQQAMLCQRSGRFETGPMDRPLGQGVMFQLYLSRLAPVLAALAARSWPIHQGPREIWRCTGDRESGQREVFVQDPDGYLLMVAQNLGERPVSE